MPEQAIKLAEKLNRHRARERTAAESCPMHSGLHPASDAIGREQRTQRQSRSQRLCHRNNVRRDSVMLIREILSGAAKATLDFIDQQQGP